VIFGGRGYIDKYSVDLEKNIEDGNFDSLCRDGKKTELI
jgi:hypothetical protein